LLKSNRPLDSVKLETQLQSKLIIALPKKSLDFPVKTPRSSSKRFMITGGAVSIETISILISKVYKKIGLRLSLMTSVQMSESSASYICKNGSEAPSESADGRSLH
jgi:hypothetical protein